MLRFGTGTYVIQPQYFALHIYPRENLTPNNIYDPPWSSQGLIYEYVN
jgi:hypothetical protein